MLEAFWSDTPAVPNDSTQHVFEWLEKQFSWILNFHTIYTPEVEHSPWKMVVGRVLSYWEGNFSGAMLNFGRAMGQDSKINSVWLIFFQMDGTMVVKKHHL